MIDSFRDAALEKFFSEAISTKHIPKAIEAALLRKLDLLNFSTSEADLRVPPGNAFEHLQGKLRGWCSIRVNKQYRLIFQWNDSRACNIYLDPHTYR